MEPITALSVAASVVALVDFGGKLLDRAFEIRRSATGQPQDAVEILQTSKELTAMAAEARGKMQGLEARHPRHAKLIERINVDCMAIEEKLAQAVEGLTVKVSSRGIARLSSQATITIRSLLSNRQLEELRSKLDEIRSQVMFSVIMCLLDEVQETQKHVKISGEGSQVVIETLARVESKLDQVQSKSTNKTSLTRQQMIDTLWSWSELMELPGQVANPLSGTSMNTETRYVLAAKILKSLQFEGMISRRDGIEDAFPETFQWLFDAEKDGGVNRTTSDLFTRWLVSETSDAFWITGKPASGKSTLMKFITPTLHCDSGLLVASFYLWGPGTAMQKTLVGLFRSLLYQLLSQRPDLCESVAIRRHALFAVAGMENESLEWTLTELQECLLRLASKVQGHSRLALLVDGLDEFDGDHERLVSLLKNLQQDYSVKICVSSRPWVVFSDAFRQNPSLRMEDLTKPDITKYIKDRFTQCIALQELEAFNPVSIQALKKGIADRAEGVFLWVAIVVTQIINKANETPILDEIWAIFNSLPADLEALYKRIHDDLGAANERSQLQVIPDDTSSAVEFPDVSDHDKILPLVTGLLAGHTKGLLQIVHVTGDNSAIDFLHRTAFDWLQLPEQTEELMTQSMGFEPLLPILAVSGGHLRWMTRAGRTVEIWRAYPARFFHVCSQIDPFTASEETLTAVAAQFKNLECLQDAITTEFTNGLAVEMPGHVPFPSNESMSLGIVASMRSCRAYLYAKLQADPGYLKDTPFLLEAATLGFDNFAEVVRKGDIELRLATVSLLVDHGVKVSKTLKRALSRLSEKDWEAEFTIPPDEEGKELAKYYFQVAAEIIQNAPDNAEKNGKWTLPRFVFRSKKTAPRKETAEGRIRTLEPLKFRAPFL
ncbi:hypothetical protein V8F20_009031 [Naviculisporaceae sp. PSN 640]